MDVSYFKTVVNQISPIPQSEWVKFAPHCSIKTYKKNEYILRSGEYSPFLGLVMEGLVKKSYTHKSGKEFVHYFGQKNQMIGAFTSILRRQPTQK